MPITNPRWADRWQAECERVALSAADVIRISGRRPCGSAIVELLRTAPRTPDEAVPADSFFARCVREATDRWTDAEGHAMQRALDYFGELASMPPARRLMLEACLAGAFLGCAMVW